MKKTLCVMMALLTLTAPLGCANRTANPIPNYSPGDEGKSCRVIQLEMEQILRDIDRKTEEAGETETKNAIYAIMGILVLFPWFLMDVSNADKIEIDALRTRYDALGRLAVQKECQFEFKHFGASATAPAPATVEVEPDSDPMP